VENIFVDPRNIDSSWANRAEFWDTGLAILKPSLRFDAIWYRRASKFGCRGKMLHIQLLTKVKRVSKLISVEGLHCCPGSCTCSASLRWRANPEWPYVSFARKTGIRARACPKTCFPRVLVIWEWADHNSGHQQPENWFLPKARSSLVSSTYSTQRQIISLSTGVLHLLIDLQTASQCVATRSIAP
jgi:hypothetical protein